LATESALALAKARRFNDEQPRHLQHIAASKRPAGLPDIKASTCGACHQEIYAEWHISTHARAWSGDPQFQAELAKAREDGGDVSWMCKNCHTPLEQQLETLVVSTENGLQFPTTIDNPSFDPDLQDEGITCATCHVKDGKVLGPWGESNIPHATQKDPSLRTNDVCTQCHQASVGFPDLNLACMFETGEEFEKSDSNDGQTTCQTCHMPEIVRPLVEDGDERTTRRHWFAGSLIPKRPQDAQMLETIESHYPEALAIKWQDLPKTVRPGASTKLNLVVTNEGAGHQVPTGDPERFIQIDMLAASGDNTTLATSQVRFGQKHQWTPTIKKLEDTRIGPGESKTLTLEFVAPQQGNVRLSVKGSKWRITDENMDYHELHGKTVPSRQFFDNSWSITVAR